MKMPHLPHPDERYHVFRGCLQSPLGIVIRYVFQMLTYISQLSSRLSSQATGTLKAVLLLGVLHWYPALKRKIAAGTIAPTCLSEGNTS